MRLVDTKGSAVSLERSGRELFLRGWNSAGSQWTELEFLGAALTFFRVFLIVLNVCAPVVVTSQSYFRVEDICLSRNSPVDRSFVVDVTLEWRMLAYLDYCFEWPQS